MSDIPKEQKHGYSPLLEVLEKILLKRAETSRPPRAGVFYPSKLAGCTRELFYAFIGEKGVSQDTAQGVLRMWHGEQIHEMVQAIFESLYGKRFQAEVAFKTDHPISGRADGVVELKALNKSGPRKGKPIRFGVEIKSANQSNFKKWKEGPSESHRVQATIYMVCLDLDFMHIVYYNKNDELEKKRELMAHMLPMKEFRIDRDPGIWKMVENKMEAVKQAAKSGTPPTREISWLCHYCAYFGTCKPQMP